MPARIPLDVDLEDKLLYGLTPMRLAYLVVSLLGGFSLWSSEWSAQPVRASACVAVIGLGMAMAWGRWRARAADQWLTDLAIFITRRYRIVCTARLWHRCARS
ncbi:MAG: hypothetical protein AUH69_11915 [Actinobacteria bacterium 13_1_40CM_4_65_12]|nr:MAG: hypothetical protein AUH69_11915 [Actinobacteria bacterium 13_1_40CM_4_65_12]